MDADSEWPIECMGEPSVGERSVECSSEHEPGDEDTGQLDSYSECPGEEDAGQVHAVFIEKDAGQSGSDADSEWPSEQEDDASQVDTDSEWPTVDCASQLVTDSDNWTSEEDA